MAILPSMPGKGLGDSWVHPSGSGGRNGDVSGAFLGGHNVGLVGVRHILIVVGVL